MYKLLITAFLISSGARAQSPDTLISDLKNINNSISALSGNGHEMLVSNRAMNLFLANKVGSYLSEGSDLSYFKNNVTFHSRDGELTVNHSLFQASGIDNPVKSFMVVGAKANILNAFASSFSRSSNTNELGFTIRQTWIGHTQTNSLKCETPNVSISCPKNTMDALRSEILHRLESEIIDKLTFFEKSLKEMIPAEVPGQDVDRARTIARKKFLSDLQTEYSLKFAALQSEALINTNNYTSIHSSWTSLSFYLPLIRQNYLVANNYTDNFQEKHTYPAGIFLSHTGFWENTKVGRLFLSLSARVFLNNSCQALLLREINYSDYKSLGGKDTSDLLRLNPVKAYIGNYSNFINPSLNIKVVYIPPDWHFGLTFIIEQNFGTNNSLDGVFGIPIVLINKKAEPSVNFEFQFRYVDISNQIQTGKLLRDKTSVCITMGIPFSKIFF